MPANAAGTLFYFISFLTRAGSPQKREPIIVGPYYQNPSQLSLWGETRVPKGNPRLRQSVNVCSSHDDWVREVLTGNGTATLEVKGKLSSNHFV